MFLCHLINTSNVIHVDYFEKKKVGKKQYTLYVYVYVSMLLALKLDQLI